jgi:hypothetical protein
VRGLYLLAPQAQDLFPRIALSFYDYVAHRRTTYR